ncbi:MAG: hypothetical protein SH856_14225 [Flavobacteriales bacterium]|nr:hypothetical protein [Flavobacteriales bacterium]
MKITITLILLSIAFLSAHAQAPQAIKYQGVIRASNGDLLGDSTFTVKITIHDSVINGPVVYEELHTTTTNSFGSFALNVGQGTVLSGVFAEVEWGTGDKYLEQNVDFGSGFISTGAMQFLSVPYALHAANGLPTGGTTGQVLSIDSNGNFIWLDPSEIGITSGGSNGKTLVFTTDGF